MNPLQGQYNPADGNIYWFGHVIDVASIKGTPAEERYGLLLAPMTTREQNHAKIAMLERIHEDINIIMGEPELRLEEAFKAFKPAEYPIVKGSIIASTTIAIALSKGYNDRYASPTQYLDNIFITLHVPMRYRGKEVLAEHPEGRDIYFYPEGAFSTIKEAEIALLFYTNYIDQLRNFLGKRVIMNHASEGGSKYKRKSRKTKKSKKSKKTHRRRLSHRL
jgi:hypothetical protein